MIAEVLGVISNTSLIYSVATMFSVQGARAIMVKKCISYLYITA